MKRLIVIRHGQSEANRLEVHVGAKDSELSEEGRRQVRLLAESLKDEKIEAVYSSDLERAFLTANVIAKDHELEVIKDKRLREFDCGLKIASMGKNKRWIWWNDYRDKEAERFGLSSLDVKTPGGESEQDHLDRVGEFVDEIKDRRNGTVVIVAHGGTNRTMFYLLGYLGLREDGWKVKQDNTGVSEFDFDGGKWNMKRLNCLGHLDVD